MQITSKQGQWLGDIAVRESGSMEVVFEMAVKNDISITDSIIPGTLLKKPDAVDRRVMNYYKTNEIFPATELTADQNEGIEFWAIERDFIVS